MRVCVIGTGPSGLTTIKQLQDEGHDITCFEKNDGIGGIWYRGDNDGDQMKVFDSLILTISIGLMAYSDFMTDDGRLFYTHSQYFRYLRSYAETFGLRKYVVFNSTVHKVRRIGNNQWAVSVTTDGKQAEHIFDAVAVCTGSFVTPNLEVQDIDKFTGEVVHSYKYRNNRPFRGKRILVVGLAESGADIVREISDVASECTLSVRQRSYLLPRLFSGRHSTDSATNRHHHFELRVRSTHVPFPMKSFFGDGMLSKGVFSVASKAYGMVDLVRRAISGPPKEEDPANGMNNLQEPFYPLKLDIDTEWTKENVDAINDWNRRAQDAYAHQVIYSKNVSFIPNIVNGKIDVKDGTIERIEGSRVHFSDGSSKEFDTIVLCTGFKKNFSLLGEDVRVEDNNVRNLYKHAFHPDYDGRLAFIGFVRPYTGGIPICAEMQARYFALLCSNKIALPTDVRRRIQEEKAWEEFWTALSPRHTEAIPSQILFLDSIAKEIGCLMPVRKLLLHPKLLVRMWFYTFNQSCYRLEGPHNLRESALRRIMSEEPGPVGAPVRVMRHMLFSTLPHFIRPKATTLRLPPSMPRPVSRIRSERSKSAAPKPSNGLSNSVKL